MLFSVSTNSSVKEILQYTYPQLYTGKEWYIGFNAFDPALGKMRRKKIKLNSIASLTQRRKYAKEVIHRLTAQLAQGWNPWINAVSNKGYDTFDNVCERYMAAITKQYNDGIYRYDTYVSYLSYLRNIRLWNAQRHVPITYIYQFDRAFCADFLDYIYLDRGNSATTRNNYLMFLSVFSAFLLQYQYLQTKPVEGIQRIGKNVIKKERTIIAAKDMERLRDYLLANNKHYLLACYLLHYVLIRPKELSMLRIGNINVGQQTILVEAEVSKNRQAAYVTLPAKVLKFMLDLNLFSYPSNYYIFSKEFRPGSDFQDSKHFRDYWTRRIRKDLKFPPNYKFYSLKDTGITEMLRSGCDRLSVKEQARHSSLLMTDIYTPKDIKDANPLLLKYTGVL